MSQNPITGDDETTITETSVGPVRSRGKGRETYTYDFAKQGGAIGDIYLLGPELPEGAVITNSYMSVAEALTSDGGATVAVSVEAAGDIQVAAAVAGAPWSTTGLKDTTAPEPGTESGYITTTTRRQPYATVAAAALTAGRYHVVLEYDVPK